MELDNLERNLRVPPRLLKESSSEEAEDGHEDTTVKHWECCIAVRIIVNFPTQLVPSVG